MSTSFQGIWQNLTRRGGAQTQLTRPAASSTRRSKAQTFEIAPNDPLVAYFQGSPSATDINQLDFDSPTLAALKAAGARIVVPLVSQGELVGLLNLGPRLSEQEYSADDRVLLNNLASQAGPAVRVAQLVRQQQAEAREMQRLEQELQVARLIQQTLLPKELPRLPGWHLAAHYQPARAVGGDFYDFFEREDGKLVIVIGDVTDKGVPAALVMATTRATLRGASRRMLSPGMALERSNNLIFPEIPPAMFVTCLYAILDPTTGWLEYANAGHDLPYCRRNGAVGELRATGMPLGLMPDMRYEEKKTILEPGDTLLLYTDGLVEAHDPQREMFSFPRLQSLLASSPAVDRALIDFLMKQLGDFTGANWEQEDDVTLLVLRHESTDTTTGARSKALTDEWRTLAEFIITSEPGNERIAMQQVGQVVADLLPAEQVERLKTAVAEATMNAIEYGNKNNPALRVTIQVLVSAERLAVRITDQGGYQVIPETSMPDLEAKLAGAQSPRGWGLFLIKSLVDELKIIPSQEHNTFELILHLKGGKGAKDGV